MFTRKHLKKVTISLLILGLVKFSGDVAVLYKLSQMTMLTDIPIQIGKSALYSFAAPLISFVISRFIKEDSAASSPEKDKSDD